MMLLRCMSPLLARFGHAAMSALSPLPGVKRKSDLRAVRSAFDPRRTSQGEVDGLGCENPRLTL
jgi:hypothetical protein